MSEKRKPSVKIVAAVEGKKRPLVIECYPASLWGHRGDNTGRVKYRVRIRGKWAGGRVKEFWTMTKIINDLRVWIVR